MKIKSGRNFSALLTNNGDVYMWGTNDYGQIGIGIRDKYPNIKTYKPTKIEFELGFPIKYISAGPEKMVAIDVHSNVYIWGAGTSYLLGTSNNEDAYIPTLVNLFTDKNIKKIYLKYGSAFALTHDGKVYSWGHNEFGNLGLGHMEDVYFPTLINFPNNVPIKKIYAGNAHVFALDIHSKIYSWGSNRYYQLCSEKTVSRFCRNRNSTMQPICRDCAIQHTPTLSEMLDGYNVNKILCMYDSTVVLADHKSYYIGILGENIKSDVMTRINIDNDDVIDNIYGTDYSLFFKMANGNIYTWEGEINKYHLYPVKINTPTNITFKKINYYNGQVYAITVDGEIYKWKSTIFNKNISDPEHVTYFTNNNINIKFTSNSKSARNIYN